MRPSCTSLGGFAAGSTWNHCAAVRVGLSYGRNTVCEHQMVPVRRRQLMRRPSPVSILVVDPSCGPKSPSSDGESAQLSFVATVTAFLPVRKVSEPTGPSTLVNRNEPVGRLENSVANACTRYKVFGLRFS